MTAFFLCVCMVVACCRELEMLSHQGLVFEQPGFSVEKCCRHEERRSHASPMHPDVAYQAMIDPSLLMIG